MNKKQYILLVFLALIGGIIGGVLSQKIFEYEKVYAETKSPRESAEAFLNRSKKIIEAEEFRIIDYTGNICARLMSENENNGETTVKLELLKDSPGNAGVSIIASAKGGYLSLRSPKSYLSLNTEDSANLLLTSEFENYNNSIFLFTGGGKGGEANLMIDRYLQNGKNLFGRGLDTPGIIEIKVGSDCLPTVVLHDKNNRSRAVLGKTELTDKSGSTIIRPPSSLVLFDENGFVKWRAP